MSSKPSARFAAKRKLLAACVAAAIVTGGHISAAISNAPAPSAVITVDSCADSGPGTLRQAVADANAGDMIQFDDALACSAIALTSGEIAVNVPDLTIQGPGRDLLAIDGGAAGRVFNSAYGLTVSDLTVRNGADADGAGGCILTQDSLRLTRATISGCSGGDGLNPYARGGGVSVGGDLVLEASTLSGNDILAGELAAGGGAYVFGDLEMTDSVIDGNTASSAFDGRGGGVYVFGTAILRNSLVSGNGLYALAGPARGGGFSAHGAVTLRASEISGNVAHSTDGTALGGGVFGYGGAIVVAESSRIRGNEASSQSYWSAGGGIADGLVGAPGGTILLLDSMLDDNTARSDCAACFSTGGGAMSFASIAAIGSTISGNSALAADLPNAHAAGGGLATYAYGNAGAIVLGNSTVSGNRAMGSSLGLGYGGGIAAMMDSPFLISNSTVAFNEASAFGGGATGSAHAGTAPELESSIVANNVAPAAADVAPNASAEPFAIDGTHNIVVQASPDVQLPGDTSASDPKLFPLAWNGGARATHEIAACSPALDAGTNADGYLHDGRGAPYARESGAAADIGAFERQPDADRIFASSFEIQPACAP